MTALSSEAALDAVRTAYEQNDAAAVASAVTAAVEVADLQDAGAEALSDLCAEFCGAELQSGTVGGIQALLGAVSAPASSRAQVNALNVLLRLCRKHSTWVVPVVDAGALEAAVAALCAHGSDGRTVVTAAATLVHVVCTGSEVIAARALSAGVIEALISALDTHMEDTLSVSCALAALSRVLSLLEGTKHADAAVDIVRMAVDIVRMAVCALNAHLRNDGVIEKACAALHIAGLLFYGQGVTSGPQKKALSQAMGILLALLQDKRLAPRSLGLICRALWPLVQTVGPALPRCRETTLQIVVAAIRAGHNLQLQREWHLLSWCCTVLATLLHFDRDLADAALQAGAVPLLHNMLQHAPAATDEAHLTFCHSALSHLITKQQLDESGPTNDDAQNSAPSQHDAALKNSRRSKKGGGVGAAPTAAVTHEAVAAADAAAAALLAEEEAVKAAAAAQSAKRKSKSKSKKRGGDEGAATSTSAPDADAAPPGGTSSIPSQPASGNDGGAGGIAAASDTQRSVGDGAGPTQPQPPSSSAAPPRRVPPPYRPPIGAAPLPQTCAAAAVLQQPTSLSPAAAAAALLPPYLAGLHLGTAQQQPAAAPTHQPAAQMPVPAAIAPPQPPAAPLPAMRECCVCLEDVPAADMMLLLPCAHRCVCPACADALVASPPPQRRCPKCRAAVERASRVFED